MKFRSANPYHEWVMDDGSGNAVCKPDWPFCNTVFDAWDAVNSHMRLHRSLIKRAQGACRCVLNLFFNF